LEYAADEVATAAAATSALLFEPWRAADFARMSALFSLCARSLSFTSSSSFRVFSSASTTRCSASCCGLRR
jgi:hypothetical protein